MMGGKDTRELRIRGGERIRARPLCKPNSGKL